MGGLIMSKVKRALSILVVTFITAAILFTGCTAEPGGSTPTATPEPEDTTPEETPTPEPQKDPVTIIWYSGGDDQGNAELVYEKVNEILLERHNILLDFRTFPFGTYDEKMNLIINSAEDYDLCLTTQSWINKYPVQVSKGAFLALDDYLPNYPILTESLPEFLFEQARENGKIYAIPNYQITYSQWGMLFRKDLIDESGFDVNSIKTYLDIEPFWQWVVDNHPELYPTKVTYKSELIDVDHEWVSVAHDAVFNKNDPTWTLTMLDEKEESMAAQRGAWYFGQLINSMWKKGYLRPDSATVQDDSPDVAAGKYASMPGVIKPGGEIEAKEKYGGGQYDWIQVGIEKPYTTAIAARASMTAVNALSKHPEEALRMLEIMNTDAEIFNMMNFGIEDVNYTMVDGKVQPIDGSGYFYNAAWAIGNQFNAKLMVGQLDGIWEETDRLNREAEVTPINGFTFNNENVVNEIANISAVGKEFSRWEFEDDFESRYDERLAKLKAAGRDKVLAEVQAQLNAWRELNNR